MRSIVLTTLAACAVAAIGSQAFAQAPAPATPPAPPSAGGTPDKMPFDIPYGMAIGLEQAKQLMAAAEGEAKKRNWKMNIAIVDTNGDLVQFARMEGAQIASVSISINKARTAARYRRETPLRDRPRLYRHARSDARREPRRNSACRRRQDHRRHRLQRRHRRSGRPDLQGRCRSREIVATASSGDVRAETSWLKYFRRRGGIRPRRQMRFGLRDADHCHSRRSAKAQS